MKKYFLIALLAVVAVGGGVGYYMWNKPPKTAEDEKPVATLTAEALYSAFATSEAESNPKYLNKVLQVSGTVESITTDNKGATVINLVGNSDDGGIVSASFPADKKPTAEQGANIALKGICSGYLAGELLGGEVQLTQCALAQ